ncbi:zinc finger, C2H2 type [Oesophagostomum dentatum]|uniref:Zinc finger, C2H2 type n=1 Tax=Oesophagostomum dentatum TaxID=61180 RepID=A0A0B1S640_OESDE|nr:zinc finger, C2H2 type [Oesophagostomum dentatum]
MDSNASAEKAAPDPDSELVAVDLAKKPTSVPKGDYITCMLCKNMIMVSSCLYMITYHRFTNLTNHARRHAVIKKYCCAHCAFQQNERAKVRMHMLTVHHDDKSQVIVNSTPSNIKLWNYLVRKCFPNYVASIDAKWKEVDGEEHDHDFNTEGEYKCVECGECLVVSDPSVEDELSMLTLMENHLKVIHDTQCVKCVCLVCGYQNADQWDVSWHLSQRHSDAVEDVSMSIQPKANYQQLITKFFPSAAELTYARLTAVEEQSIEQFKEPVEMKECSSQSSDIELSDTEEDRNSLEKPLTCRLCNRLFEIDHLPSIATHAKSHYLIKQFECEWCGYGNNNKAVVTHHIYFKHTSRKVKIVEHNDKVIKMAWTQVARACFPSLAWKLRERRVSFLKIALV